VNIDRGLAESSVSGESTMSETSPDPVRISRAAAAVVGFLARYSSKATVSAYSLDLRLLFQWCAAQGVDPLDATRTHLELFARHLEDDRGNGPASVHRRLSTSFVGSVARPSGRG